MLYTNQKGKREGGGTMTTAQEIITILANKISSIPNFPGRKNSAAVRYIFGNGSPVCGYRATCRILFERCHILPIGMFVAFNH